ncbi:type I-E CRISPR-associated protein Cse2/CasB [Enterobacter sp. ENT03]|uniref:type I-E CRISPR-associated protein Cse2/CasB n=1 Tax=Enterobacter sp. ENT03 TaxID=2854780 RepID=UPI001C45EA51|nr:type I-E CRISPR-associated protein Cse2/CasB [Enterobacter sp. ENT03]MBV7404211.1 type I-E CRISPR-associated protein Cse2/CasB [Enterobacter sp. ENT03]
MADIDTGKPVIFTHPEAAGIVRRWFASLQERNHPGGVNGRAWRAELRRSAQPYGTLTTQGFFALMQPLQTLLRFNDSDKLALAMFASIASHVRKDNGQESVARQLGKEIKGTPCLSRSRFDRLLAARTPAELCSQLTRAVKLRGDEGVNLVSLADGIFLWMREWYAREQFQPVETNPFKRFSVRWASEYLLAAEKTSVKNSPEE